MRSHDKAWPAQSRGLQGCSSCRRQAVGSACPGLLTVQAGAGGLAEGATGGPKMDPRGMVSSQQRAFSQRKRALQEAPELEPGAVEFLCRFLGLLPRTLQVVPADVHAREGPATGCTARFAGARGAPSAAPRPASPGRRGAASWSRVWGAGHQAAWRSSWNTSSRRATTTSWASCAAPEKRQGAALAGLHAGPQPATASTRVRCPRCDASARTCTAAAGIFLSSYCATAWLSSTNFLLEYSAGVGLRQRLRGGCGRAREGARGGRPPTRAPARPAPTQALPSPVPGGDPRRPPSPHLQPPSGSKSC